jgi:hypothetical protein
MACAVGHSARRMRQRQLRPLSLVAPRLTTKYGASGELSARVALLLISNRRNRSHRQVDLEGQIGLGLLVRSAAAWSWDLYSSLDRIRHIMSSV